MEKGAINKLISLRGRRGGDDLKGLKSSDLEGL